MHGNSFRIAFLVLCCIAGFMLWQQQSTVYENQGRLSISQEDNAVVLEWNSEIDVPMVRRFQEAFSEWGNRTETFVIDLNSPGGALREGNKLIELIKDMKRSHLIITRVGPRGSCLSMCVPIYLTGETRVASPTSNWMFHEPKSVDYFSGEEGGAPEFEQAYKSERFFDRYFVNSEISPHWRDQLKQEWVGKDVWKTGQQLVNEGSNIITELR